MRPLPLKRNDMVLYLEVEQLPRGYSSVLTSSLLPRQGPMYTMLEQAEALCCKMKLTSKDA